jgi:hypothetical protein
MNSVNRLLRSTARNWMEPSAVWAKVDNQNTISDRVAVL